MFCNEKKIRLLFFLCPKTYLWLAGMDMGKRMVIYALIFMLSVPSSVVFNVRVSMANATHSPYTAMGGQFQQQIDPDGKMNMMFVGIFTGNNPNAMETAYLCMDCLNSEAASTFFRTAAAEIAHTGVLMGIAVGTKVMFDKIFGTFIQDEATTTVVSRLVATTTQNAFFYLLSGNITSRIRQKLNVGQVGFRDDIEGNQYKVARLFATTEGAVNAVAVYGVPMYFGLWADPVSSWQSSALNALGQRMISSSNEILPGVKNWVKRIPADDLLNRSNKTLDFRQEGWAKSWKKIFWRRKFRMIRDTINVGLFYTAQNASGFDDATRQWVAAAMAVGFGGWAMSAVNREFRRIGTGAIPLSHPSTANADTSSANTDASNDIQLTINPSNAKKFNPVVTEEEKSEVHPLIE